MGCVEEGCEEEGACALTRDVRRGRAGCEEEGACALNQGYVRGRVGREMRKEEACGTRDA